MASVAIHLLLQEIGFQSDSVPAELHHHRRHLLLPASVEHPIYTMPRHSDD